MQKILIVEDDLSLSEMVQELLEEEGYIVLAVPSAEQAKELIKTENISLALIDVMLPGQGGMDLILDLHASNPDLKIVITSGKIDMNKSTFKVLAHQFGVIAILPKPFTVEELLATIKETIAN